MMIQLINACNILTTSFSLYPTQNEYFIIYLNEIFQGDDINFVCQNCPAEVTINNVISNGYTFKLEEIEIDQVSSNFTHYLLRMNYQLLLYKSSDFKLETIHDIDKKIICFSSLFYQFKNILIDCYDNNNLIFKNFNQTTLNLTNNDNSLGIPISTQLYFLLPNYIIYLQYFEECQIITLFTINEMNIVNITSIYETQLLNITITLNQHIYLLYQNMLMNQYQIINQSFYLLQSIEITYTTKQAIAIGSFTSIFKHSQFDSIYLAINQSDLILEYTATSNSFQFEQAIVIKKIISNSAKILASQNFIIIQTDESYVTINKIYLQIANKQIWASKIKRCNHCQLIFFNFYTDQIYIFYKDVIVYILQQPQINGYFTNNITNLTIIGYELESLQECQVQFNFNILQLNDQNIYQTYTLTDRTEYYFPKLSQLSLYDSFSGPLIQTQLYLDKGNFTDVTFLTTALGDLTNFTFSKIYQLQMTSNLLLVGILENNIIDFYYADSIEDNFKLIYSSKINSLVTDIEIAEYYPNTIYIGINQENEIIVYNITYFDVNQFNSQIITFDIGNSYKSFLLYYDSLIVLSSYSDILVYSLYNISLIEIYEATFIQSYISQFNLTYQPQQLIYNQDNQGTLFLIDNQNSVILIDKLIQTNGFVPISFISLNYTIYQVNMMDDLVVISNQNNQNNFQFEVWSIGNISFPKYIKQLPQTTFYNNWIIQSDNNFLYVKLPSQNQIIVYNPKLTTHNSQYYTFYLNESYITSISLDYDNYQGSLISYENQFIYLQTRQMYMIDFFITNDDTDFIIETYYYFNVFNNVSSSQFQTEQQSLVLFNTLLNINISFENDENSVEDQFFPNQIYTIYFNKLINKTGQIMQYELINNQDQCQLINIFNSNCTMPVNSLQSFVSVFGPFFILLFEDIVEIYELNSNCSQGLKSIIEIYNVSQCYNSHINSQSTYFIICNYVNNSLYSSLQIIDLFYYPTNTIQINYTQSSSYFIQSFTSITSISSISNYLFILGTNNVINKIYILDITTLNMISHKMTCKDSISYINVTTLYEKQSDDINTIQFVIFYICQNEIYYQGGNITYSNYYTLNLIDKVQTVSFINQLIKGTSGKLISLIPFIVYRNQLILLITTSTQLNLICLFAFSQSIYREQILSFQDVIQIIPPIPNLQLTSFYAMNEYNLILTYQSLEKSIFLALYNVQYLTLNKTSPLTMISGYLLDMDSQIYSMSINSVNDSQSTVAMTINNNLVYFPLQLNPYISCNLSSSTNVSFKASNQYSNSNNLEILLTTQYTEVWLYLLIGLMILVFGVYFLCVYYSKNGNEEEEQYSELEL